MKKLLIQIYIIFFGIIYSFGNIYAQNIDTSKTLSRENIFEYMGEYLFPEIPKSYQYIDLKYSDIKKSDSSYKNLQKIVYSGAIPNINNKIQIQKPLKADVFYFMVEKITGLEKLSFESPSELKKRNTTLGDIIGVQALLKDFPKENENREEIIIGNNLGGYLDILKTSDEEEKIKILLDAYETLLKEYHGNQKIDKMELLYHAIIGLAEGTGDPHTVYFPPTQSKNFEEGLLGEFEGIGAYVEMTKPGVVTIISPISGSPAEKAGLKGGDIIVKVGDFEVEKNTNLADVVAKIKGPQGTKVLLFIQRNGEEIEIEVMRDKVIVHDVSTYTQKDFFVIQIDNFGEKVSREFENALREFQTSSKQKLIFDLRNNGGGYLEQVNEMLGMLLDKGLPTSVIGYKSGDYTYYASGDKILDLEKYEVYILINGATASASEIMTGTLKDYFPNIVLVGEKTYGKGSVQTMREYRDGSMLKYTIASWKTGKTLTQIDGIGIDPDVEIIGDIIKNKDDNQLEYILNK